MMFFDLLFGDSSKKIHSRDFNKALRSISSLSEEERRYLNKVFKSELADGLTAYELKQRIEKLNRIPDDSLESDEIKQVKRKLLGELRR